eukprot:SAG22_NODE_163_length_16829_cov_9.946204_5_plen_57_part_00
MDFVKLICIQVNICESTLFLSAITFALAEPVVMKLKAPTMPGQPPDGAVLVAPPGA